MGYQYQYQGGPHGIPNYPDEPPRQQRPMPPPQGRRPPPGFAPGYGAPDRLRGPLPMRPDFPLGAPSGRLPVRPPPQPQYAPPHPASEGMYDGGEYGGPEFGQADQWPLPSRPFAESHARSNSPDSGPRRPPQRPQRPDFEPPPFDPPRSQPARVAPANQKYRPPPPQQPHHGSGQWTGEGYSSPAPNPSQPGPARTPEFAPSQAAYQGAPSPAFKRPPLGPPPSARRGPSSYYSQIAPVTPIVEETDSMRGSTRNHDSMKSFATNSSNAIPIGIPDYYLEQRDSVPAMPEPTSHYESHYDESPIEHPGDGGEDYDDRDSRYDDRDLGPSPEPAMVVRQASLGKKSKPTLTTVKSGDRMRKDHGGEALPSLPSQQRAINAQQEPLPTRYHEAMLAKELGMPSESETEEESFSSARQDQYGDSEKDLEAALSRPAVPATQQPYRSHALGNVVVRDSSDMFLSSGTGLLDPSSSSESEREVEKKAPSKELLGAGLAKPPRSHRKSPLATEYDPRVETILGGLERGGALNPNDSKRLKAPTAGLSQRAGKRRPPRLDVDAVRDAEARGSLTSLPDLIKRATRLASNLDSGKTASRLGMNWFDGAVEGDTKHRSAQSDNRRSGSISDILASFPPPGLATPTGSRHGDKRRSFTNWSSHLRHSVLPSDSDGGEAPRQRKRRCCGLPLWLFLLLLSALVLLVAAAIIVPVVLIVIPRQNAASSSNAVAGCTNKLNCANSGTNVAGSDGSCKCLCTNGYTGTLCTTNSQAGCTTTTAGTTSNATVGTAIPRLLSGASTNFSVPLNGQSLLVLFNGADMSCASENALVTFNNHAARSLPELETWLPTPTIEKRETASTTSGAVTSNGIVFMTGVPSGSTASSSPAPDTASPAASSSSSAANYNSSTAIDFARVAVLYVFQASGQLGSATIAQSNLQAYFTSGQTSTGQIIDPSSVSLGNGFMCDLGGHGIWLGNGTRVGGGGASG